MENAGKVADAPPRARQVLAEFVRTLWYLRAFLASLLVIFLVLSAVMYYAGGPVEAATRTPSSPELTLYFCSITALTIGYGDVVPTTTVGRIDSILLGVVGLLITGIVIAASVRAVQQASHRAGISDEAL
jgi:voltage-gated potassium channel